MAGTGLNLSPAQIAQIEKEIKELNYLKQNLQGVATHLLTAMPITFDSLPPFRVINDGDIVDTIYQSLGAKFSSYSGGHTYARAPLFGAAHGGQNVISTAPLPAQRNDCALGEPDGIKAFFTTPQRIVYVWAYPLVVPGSGIGPTIKDAPYLSAYDANGNKLGTVSYPSSVLNAPSPGWQQLQYVSNSANIAHVQFSCTVNQGGSQVVAYFDDFAFFS